jgi:hypothetical protein
MQSFGRQTRRKSAPLLLAGAVSCTDWSMLEAHGDDRAVSEAAVETFARPRDVPGVSSAAIAKSADRIREPQTSAKSTDRWNNEGGAPSGGGRSARKRRRGTSLQKKAAAEKSPKKQPRWPDKRAGA